MSEDITEVVARGYRFDGPTLELGALVVDGAAKADVPVRIPLAMLNRHGLIAGATGTGKTKTLQVMAEQLSALGVPVFAADIKGDLSGLATAGDLSERVSIRAREVGQQWQGLAAPTEFYALGAQGQGIPLRATVTSFGPTLLAKVLGLNDVQESSLGLVFHFADKAGLPMLDLKDLRAVVAFLAGDEGKEALKELGGLARATAGVILRKLIALEDQGAEAFFGEPEFDTADLLRTTDDGRGIVSLLELPQLQDRPALFSTFLMWLLADLYDDLPEVGDLDKPKLVFFFDEAHLLFDDASKPFLDAIAQTVRLIRSKGIGVFFVTHTPKDVPEDVLAQLSNRVQHALRAFTPNDAKALKATVSTFPHSAYDLDELLTQLGIGEAVITVLSDRGAPTPVAWTRLRAPLSRMAPTAPEQIAATIAASPLNAEYATAIDRDSAYERLAARLAEPGARNDDPAAASPDDDDLDPVERPRTRPRKKSSTRRHVDDAGWGRPDEGSAIEKAVRSPAAKQFARSAAAVLGREIARSIFGTARRRRRRR